MVGTPPPKQAGSKMRSLRERQREERADLILETAREVFADKGYHGASIEDIAARAGIAKGTVYLHFPSKEDLLAALAALQITAFATWVDRVVSEPLSVRERLVQLLVYVYRRIQERQNQVLLELYSGTGLTTQVLDRRADLQAQLTRALKRIEALIEEGKRTNELDPEVPTPIMAATLAALLAPNAYESLLRSGQTTPEELATWVSRLFFPAVIMQSADA